MFDVIIALEKVGQKESLAEACQLFVQKMNEMLRKNGGASDYVIYQACMIETEIGGVKCMMNVDAINAFSHAAGILKDDGTLIDRPAPYVPSEYARNVFLAADRDTLEAYIIENKEIFAKMTEFSQEPPQIEPAIVIAPR